MASATQRQMQMLVTRFERLSRRISLAGLMSGHQAGEAISQGRVRVDGRIATSNFKVFGEALVTLDGRDVPAPGPLPKLWGFKKPKKVLCQTEETEGKETIRGLMRKWSDKEHRRLGDAQCIGLDEEALHDRHFIVVCSLPFGGDGMVLATNDGLFAKALQSTESRILTEYDVKVAGDPPVDLLHSWRKGGARAGGVNFGQVYTSITSRSPSACWLRIRYVESPERPIELLLERARLRAHRLRRHAFGPYLVTQLQEDRIRPFKIHRDLMHLIPPADVRQTLVATRGGIVSSDGSYRSIALEGSAVVTSMSPPLSATADIESVELDESGYTESAPNLKSDASWGQLDGLSSGRAES